MVKLYSHYDSYNDVIIEAYYGNTNDAIIHRSNFLRSKGFKTMIESAREYIDSNYIIATKIIIDNPLSQVIPEEINIGELKGGDQFKIKAEAQENG